MPLVKALLNNRSLCEFADTNSRENVIFCQQLEESLYDICNVVYKNGELITKIINESHAKYIYADVVLENGTCYENVKFRVEESSDINLPIPIINLKMIESPDTARQMQPAASKQELIVEEDLSSSELKEDVLNIEQELKTFEDRKQRERVQLRETNEYLAKTLEQYKAELVDEYYKIKGLYDVKSNEINVNVEQLTKDYKKTLTESAKKILKGVEEKIVELVEEKKNINLVVDSVKEYTDQQVARASQSAKDFARRILDLGAGGGSNAKQYARGGTMEGTLNVTGQYLSAGTDLFDIFLTSETDSQTLSYNDAGTLSLTNSDSVVLSSFNNIELKSANIQTYTTEVSATGNFLLLNLNGSVKAIRLWDVE